MASRNSIIQLFLLLMVACVCVLFLLICIGPRCDDGECNGEETYADCPMDCPKPPRPAVADNARCGDGSCEAPEDAASCPVDCKGDGDPDDDEEPDGDEPEPPAAAGKGDPEPEGSPTGGVGAQGGGGVGGGGAGAGGVGAPTPLGVQPEGRCQDPEFRQIIKNVLSRCERACSVDDANNPLIDLSKREFEQLFAHDDDAGYASYIAIFGCNSVNPRTGDCRGYDAYFAEEGECPDTPAGYKAGGADSPGRCRKYAGAIEGEFDRFVQANKGARHFILLGSASTTGNTTEGGRRRMSGQNMELARRRAQNVEVLLEKLRKRDPFNASTYTVILDNEAQDYNSSGFLGMVRTQIDKLGKTDRGFTPTGALAINRSVMVMAISCDLDN